jgi:hypothetical protein
MAPGEAGTARRVHAAARRTEVRRRLAAVHRRTCPRGGPAAILHSAELLLGAEWEARAAVRTDLVQPDWLRDPVTGRRSPQDRYTFLVDHRSEEQVGNVKQVWELSRLQHLTLLAAAMTSDTRAGSPTTCAHGGRRTRSCPARTGPAASNSLFG